MVTIPRRVTIPRTAPLSDMVAIPRMVNLSMRVMIPLIVNVSSMVVMSGNFSFLVQLGLSPQICTACNGVTWKSVFPPCCFHNLLYAISCMVMDHKNKMRQAPTQFLSATACIWIFAVTFFLAIWFNVRGNWPWKVYGPYLCIWNLKNINNISKFK